VGVVGAVMGKGTMVENGLSIIDGRYRLINSAMRSTAIWSWSMPVA
jgi:hypothetical protein